MTTDMTTKPERVGILLVHGIGETKKFQNIEAVARDIATALQSDKSLAVRIIINTKDDGEYGACQQTWLGEDKEPLTIEVKDYYDPHNSDKFKLTELIFSEVWWADIGKSNTFNSKLSFWMWGLSLWSREQFLGKKQPKSKDEDKFGTLNQVHLPQNVSNDKTPQIKFFDRVRFFVVSWVVLLILPLLSLLNAVFSRVLGITIPSDILDQYLGDVKHYQQDKREGAGYLIDIGKPPRISVRRRMIKALVKMGLADYDRWYVLSHSLGTVVAFNGLMEPDAVLPNYLNQDLWEKCAESGHLKTTTTLPLTKEQAKNMFPSRPSWLGLDNIIARADLFKNLKGFMTYGSPLSKFAVIWPAIVPINKDNSVFSADFEWINIYDPTDPVSDETKYFDLENYGGKKPVDIAYKADSIHLLSHLTYFTYNAHRSYPLVKPLSQWLLKGDKFQPAAKKSWGWPGPNIVLVYVFIRYLIWLIIGFLVSFSVAFLLDMWLPHDITNFLGELGIYIDDPFLYCGLSVVIVFIVGVLARLINQPSASEK